MKLLVKELNIFKRFTKKKDDRFDIVIVLNHGEITFLNKQIEFINKYINGFRKIFIITNNKDISIENCTIISENRFPFTTDNKYSLKELFKLYSYNYIPNILDNYLVVDSGVYFQKIITFFEKNIQLFNTIYNGNKNTLEHMTKLHPTLFKQEDFLNEKDRRKGQFYQKNRGYGNCNFMFFQKKYIKNLIKLIENKHKKPFWKVFIENILVEKGTSIYEIYFHYITIHHPKKYKIKNLYSNTVKEIPIFSPYDYMILKK